MHSVRNSRVAARACFALAAVLAVAQESVHAQNCATPASGNPCVLTDQYDNNRDAYNGNETVLTSNTVTSTSMAQLFTLAVDTNDLPSGQLSNPIYGQPLYVAQMPQVGSPAATHDLLIAVTLNGTVFAWDAENQPCTGTSPLCWSRQGTGGPQGTNALWYDDCGSQGSPVINTGNSVAALPFAGIVTTPVIDTTLSPPAIFLTNYCQNHVATPFWYLHRLLLQNGRDDIAPALMQSPPSANPDDNFTAKGQLQRPALLEAPIPAVAGVSPVIYIGFGTATSEGGSNPYHGWLFGYNTSLVLQFAFSTTSRGCGSGGQTTQCADFGSSASPSCDCLFQAGFQNAPNWGGHGGGIWMSGRGPAANTPSTLGDGFSHVFLGSGNGGFQAFQGANGKQLPNSYGLSMMDFRLSPTVMDQTPYQSFTPWSAVVAPNLSTSACDNPNPPPAAVPCAYTFENMNENDYDQALTGVLLFNDLSGTPRLLTLDKAGYGYLLTQGNLCGPGVSGCSLQNGTSSVQGFAPGDNGNIFPFGPVLSPSTYFCTDKADACARVTSLAFANNTLYLWPYQEKLTALPLSDNSPQKPPGAAAITSSGTTVTGTETAFLSWIIAGDTITDTVTGQSRTVTQVTSGTQLQVNAAFSPDISGSGDAFTYNGYFINPVQDVFPSSSAVGFAGGSLVATSDGPGGGIVWAIVASVPSPKPNPAMRTPGSIFAYSTKPVSNTLKRLWSSPTDEFCVSTYALPTVVHGYVYVPTYAIAPTGDTSNACPPTVDPNGAYQSGVLVYGLSTN